MPRFAVTCEVEVEAANASEAFKIIRSHYSMTNDATETLPMFVGEVEELADDESVYDFA